MTERIDFGEFSEDLQASIQGVIETADVARVLSYDRATQTASVLPVTRRRELDPDTGESVYQDPEPINQVPVAFPQAGGFSITWDLASGDFVLVMYMGRSIDEWAATGNNLNSPADIRRQDLNDAIAIPGVSSSASPLTAIAAGAMVFGGDEFRFGSESVSTFLARSDRVEAELNDLRSKLNSFIAAFNAHTHPTAPVGPISIPTPVLIPGPVPIEIPVTPANPIGSTASDKVKGE